MGYSAVNSHARWGTDGASVSWDDVCGANITDVETSDNKVLLMQVDNTNAHGDQSITVVLQYSKDGGAWTTLTSSTDWIYQAAQAFNDGDATTAGVCSAPVGNWVNGEKDENNSLPALLLDKDEWTEYWFSIRGANAAGGSDYEFRLYDTAEGAEVPPGGNLTSYIKATISTAGQDLFQTCTEGIGVSDARLLDASSFRSEALGVSDVIVKSSRPVLLESLGVSDELVKVLTAYKLITEALSLADSTLNMPGLLKAESIGIADSRIVSDSILKGESIGISDTFSESWDAYKTLTETMGLTDTELPSVGKVVSESLGVSDSILSVWSAYRILVETLGFTDTKLLNTRRVVLESLGLGDAVLKRAKPVYSANITLSDVKQLGVSNILSEALSMTDARLTTTSIVKEEALTLVDQVTRLLTYIRVLTESLGLLDEIVTQLTYKRLFSETLSILDTKLFQTQKILLDTLDIADAVLKQLTYHRTLSEALGLSDVKLLMTSLLRSESIAVSDAVLEQVSFYRTLVESFGIADTRLAKVMFTLTESVTLSDVLLTLLTYKRLLEESLGLQDVTEKDIGSVRSESLSLTDTFSREVVYERLIQETLALADAIEFLRTKLLQENISIQDVYSKTWNSYRTFDESMAILDSRLSRISKPISETLTLGEAIRKGAGKLVEESITFLFPNWTRMKKNKITGSSAGAVTDYCVKMIVHKGSGVDSATDVYCDGHCNDDFSDIRWASESFEILDYWIEKVVSGDYAIFWIELNQIPASPNTVDIHMFYGNVDASSESDGDETFIFFDHFDSSFDGSRWTYGITFTVADSIATQSAKNGAFMAYTNDTFLNKACRFLRRHRTYDGTSNHAHQIGFQNTSVDNVCRVYSYNTANFVTNTQKDGNSTDIQDGAADTGWHVDDIRWSSNRVEFLVDDTQEIHTTNIPTISLPFAIRAYAAGSAYTYVDVDWMFIRNYVYPEPAWNSWSEERTIYFGVDMSRAETLTLGDARIFDIGKPLYASLSIVDAVQRSVGKSIIEYLAISDSDAFDFSRYLTETLSLTDEAIKGHGKIIEESIAIGDSLTYVKILKKYLSETMVLTDSFSRNVAYKRAFLETLAIQDIKLLKSIKELLESMSIAESTKLVIPKILDLYSSVIASLNMKLEMLSSLSMTTSFIEATDIDIDELGEG